jgi:predicted NACHT family NTPase
VRDQVLADLERLGVSDFAANLGNALVDGRCLLVLDGLDEVPYDLRPRVRSAAAAVITEYHPQRIIVTCRVRSYVGETVLPNFQAHTLAPFDEDQVRRFVQAWYKAQYDLGRLDNEQAGRKADDLIRAALSADLQELSANPMMLTTMAIIHQREVGLPRERVRLYSLAVEVLLQRWQKRKSGEAGLTPSPDLANLLKDDLRLRQVMERLAYETHQAHRSRNQAADLARGKALELLEQREYLGQAGLAAQFLDYVDQRSGLLTGRGGELGRPATYSFPHRTFQEYLAGCYLIGRADVAREFFVRAGEGDYWALAA